MAPSVAQTTPQPSDPLSSDGWGCSLLHIELEPSELCIPGKPPQPGWLFHVLGQRGLGQWVADAYLDAAMRKAAGVVHSRPMHPGSRAWGKVTP